MHIRKQYCLVLLLFCNLYTIAQSNSGTEKISLYLNNATLIDVIKGIEAKSKFSFVYNTTIMKNAQNICIDVEDVDVNRLMGIIGSNSGNNYKVINNQVVFYKVNEITEKSFRIKSKPNKKEMEPYVSSPSFDRKKQNTTVKKTINTKPTRNKIEVINTLKPIKAVGIFKSKETSIFPFHISTQCILIEKKAPPRFFFSAYIDGIYCVNPSFYASDSLNGNNAELLNNYLSSNGYGAGINIRYEKKRFAIQTGLYFSQITEEVKVNNSYNVYNRNDPANKLIWEEYNDDGIFVFTNNPNSTTISNHTSYDTHIDVYSYFEIPLAIEYTLLTWLKWDMYACLETSYALYANRKHTTDYLAYQSQLVPKLDISMGGGIGIKYCPKKTSYFLMLTNNIKTSLNAKDAYINRNPVFINLRLGIINPFSH